MWGVRNTSGNDHSGSPLGQGFGVGYTGDQPHPFGPDGLYQSLLVNGFAATHICKQHARFHLGQLDRPNEPVGLGV